MDSLLLKRNEALLIDASVRQLCAFATVAETLSYTEAASRLHYTQQGVNAQIRRLEHLSGCRLVERSGRGLHLTGEGRALLPACLEVLDAVARLERIHSSFRGVGRVTIVASLATGAYLLPAVIQGFTAQHPQTHIDLLTVPRDEVMPLITAGTAKIAVANIVAHIRLPPGFLLTYWLDEPWVLLRSPTSLPVSTLPVFVYHTLDQLEHSVIAHKLWAAGIQEYELRRLPSSEAVKGACEAGLGYGYLPRTTARLELQAGILEQVTGFSSPGPVWICHPPPEELSGDARAVLRFLIEKGPALVLPEKSKGAVDSLRGKALPVS